MHTDFSFSAASAATSSEMSEPMTSSAPLSRREEVVDREGRRVLSSFYFQMAPQDVLNQVVFNLNYEDRKILYFSFKGTEMESKVENALHLASNPGFFSEYLGISFASPQAFVQKIYDSSDP